MSNYEERVFAEHERRFLEPSDPKSFFCERCLCEIHDGERMWKINGSIFCDSCAQDLYSEEVEE